MQDRRQDNNNDFRSSSGFVLVITLILLVVLTIMGYALSSRVAAYRHRQKYIIDYQAARYGCESAIKYALDGVDELTVQLVSRPNEPDFSDLFHMTDAELEEFIAEWAAELQLREQQSMEAPNEVNDLDLLNYFGGIVDAVNDVNMVRPHKLQIDYNDPNTLDIPGPYGPPWPLVTEPVEFEIGTAKITIEIEDENAKYPIGWIMLDDEKTKREAVAGFKTFCEWMDVNEVEIESLQEELDAIREIKQFKLSFEDTKTKKQQASARQKAKSRGRRRGSTRTTTKKPTIPATTHVEDFANIFHSSLIDNDILARCVDLSETRKESAKKYAAMWGSATVNINTAPRHVLESAFTFGGDATEIAEEIIQIRRVKPFDSLDDLRSALTKYGVSIRKCEKFITTASTFFTVRITAVSGTARVSAVIGITKTGKKVQKIGLMAG